MEEVTAAGGVLYDPIQKNVVLILRNGVWDLPKGKLEVGESIEECARREVAEETGIPAPQIKGFLAETRHQYKRKGLLYHKVTHWYEMYTAPQYKFTPQRVEGIERVIWTDIDQAYNNIGYANLKVVLQVLAQKYA